MLSNDISDAINRMAMANNNNLYAIYNLYA